MTTSQTITSNQTKQNIKSNLSFKRFISRLAVFVTFFLFVGTGYLIVRMVTRLSIPLFLLCISLMILQKLFLKKNHKIIKWLNSFRPDLFFNKFQKIFQSDIPESNVLFAHHPHGVWSLGLILSLNQGNDPYSQMVQLGSRFALNIPFIGAFLRVWGIQSVHAANMNRLMSNGTNIGLVPGGYEQATINSHDKFRIYIKRRKGFIKMALKTGYKICPVLIMNQHKMYRTTDIGLKFRLLLNKIKIPGAAFWGRFGLMPDYNLDIYTVVGKPIQMPTIKNPSTEEVKKWHKHYIQVVTELYEKYKHLNQNVPLQIY